MSDTFNHEADAWDDLSFDIGYEDGEEGYGLWERSKRCRTCGKAGLYWARTPDVPFLAILS